MVAWRYAESLADLRAGARDRPAVGARAAEAGRSRCWAPTWPTSAAARKGSPISGRPCGSPSESAIGSAWSGRTSALTDALTMLGRPRESARRGRGRARGRCAATGSTAPCSSRTASRRCSRSASGTRRTGRAPPRFAASRSSFPYWLLILRADIEIGRGELRRRASAPRGRERDPAGGPRARHLRRLPRRPGALGAPLDRGGRRPSRSGWRGRASRDAAQIRVQLCARGLRAHAELAALARARRDADAVRRWLDTRAELVAIARRRRQRGLRGHAQRRGLARAWPRPSTRAPAASAQPETWSEAAATWERLERPPLAAYCRWREAETLVAAGASRAEASAPLRQAYAVAARIGARPLLQELELLAQRARLELVAPERRAGSTRGGSGADPRPDTARGGRPDARRAWLHEP